MPRPTTIARALEGVDLDAGITIDFNLSPPTRVAVDHVAALVKARKLDPAAVDLRASLNPIGGFAAAGASAEAVERTVEDSCRRACAISPTRAFAGPSSSPTGASSTMPAARRRRSWPSPSPPRSIACARWKPAAWRSMPRARMIYFRLAADADEFLTIAKFRAIRKLWARVEEACGLDAEADDGRRRDGVAHADQARP